MGFTGVSVIERTQTEKKPCFIMITEKKLLNVFCPVNGENINVWRAIKSFDALYQDGENIPEINNDVRIM